MLTFCDKKWHNDLTILTDSCAIAMLAKLNLSLQGRDKLITDLFECIKSFKRKLNLLE